MKELSIEEKAKAYDMALENAKHYHSEMGDDICCVLEECFPILKESEDERIRKNLIELFHDTVSNDEIFSDYGLDKTKVLAWLEKQGEQEEPQVYETENGEVITYSKSKGYKVIEPKFKVGDWIIRNAEGFKHNTYLVTEVKDYYVCEELKGRRVTFTFNDVHKNFRLWDITKDAKNGDVLITNKRQPFIFNGHYDEDTDYIYAYCGIADIVKDDSFYIEEECVVEEFKLWCTNENVCPATKEQRNNLIKVMTDAGYTFDFEKKELKKTEPIPAWSEEDDKMYNSLTEFEKAVKQVMVEAIECGDTHNLKADADMLLRLTQKPWSEEDEDYINDLIKYFSQNERLKNTKEDIVNWLKSLKDRMGK